MHGGGPLWEQEAFRIRNDDGNETGASWMYTLNTDGEVEMDTIFRVRFLIDEYNGNAATEGFRIQYDDGGGYTNVTGTSPLQWDSSGNVTNGENATQQISTGNYTNGDVVEGTNVTGALAVAANDYTEHEFVLTLDSAQLTDNDTISLRLVEDGGGLLDLYTQFPDITARTPADVGQEQFRFREDDGNETGASWVQATNVDATLDIDKNYRIRFGLDNDGGFTASDQIMQLQYNKNSGGWNDVTGASSNVRSFSSGNITDGGDTTQQVTAGAFVTNNDGIDDSNGVAGSTNTDLTGGDATEYEFCFQVRNADTVDGDTIDLRLVYDSGGGTLDRYVVTPTLTVDIPVLSNLMLGFHF